MVVALSTRVQAPGRRAAAAVPTWVLAAVGAAASAAANPVVRPQDFGGVGDGAHNDTSAMLAAVAKCASLGACDLVVSNGTFLTGPIALDGVGAGSRLVLTASGGLRAMARADWLAAGWRSRAVLTGSGLEEFALVGPGAVDGQGAAWWAQTHNDLTYRPGMVALTGVRGLQIDDVRLVNSPNHNVVLSGCSRVRVTGLRVEAPGDSPNTDGINFGGGSDQSIVDSHISNGDDCVSIVAEMPPGAPAGSMAFGGGVLVRNVTCVNGHGVSIGSIRHGTVTNVTVENVSFTGSENAARIKTYPNNTGLVSGVTYRGITVSRVGVAMLIDGKYCPKSQKPWPCPPGNHAVAIRDVAFEGFRGDVASRGGVGVFDCSALSPCANVTLSDVALTVSEGEPASADKFVCSHISGPAPVAVSPPSCVQPPTRAR